MKEEWKTVVILVAVGLLVVVALVMPILEWRECRRVHPFWYCISK